MSQTPVSNLSTEYLLTVTACKVEKPAMHAFQMGMLGWNGGRLSTYVLCYFWIDERLVGFDC